VLSSATVYRPPPHRRTPSSRRRSPAEHVLSPNQTPSAFDPFAGARLLAQSPSTEPQREIWTAARLSPEASRAYNESVTLALSGPLDPAALQQALAQVQARHEALRATFSEDGTALLVTEASPLALAPEDLSGRPEAEQAERLAAVLAEEVEHDFDLARGPLLRARLLRMAPSDHRLVLTAHHLVCDGWSTAVILRELGECYSARVEGRPERLPPAPSFAAYARRELEAASSPEVAEAGRFWEERLAGGVPPLELPLDHARPPVRTFRARRVDVVLPAPLISALRKACAKERASLFHGLLAGFFSLLHRLSGAEDLAVAIPSAGQSLAPELAGLVGHCVNTLPIRGRPHAGLQFRELLAAIKGAVLDAQDHQQLSYGALLRRLPLTRDPSRAPLLSVCFNLDRGMTPESLPFAGLRASVVTNPRHAENFELFLNAVELGDEVHVECQYNADLFERGTIERWLAGYGLLLRAAAEGPQSAIGALSLLTPEDAAQVAAWNAASALAVDPAARAHLMVEAQADAAPEAVAVSAAEGRVTYAQLEARANRIARRLRALGVQRGTLVGLCLERTPDLLAALLGILKAGGAYVPLDPGHPRERLASMVADSKLPVLVTSGRLREELGLQAGSALLVDDASLDAEQATRLASGPQDAGAEDPAYVLYTSGSTGKPKGVLVPHRALANLLASVQKTPGLARGDVALAVTTLSFDIAVSEVLLPLTVGATVALVTREVAADGALLLRALREEKVTFVDATPATWRLLLAAGWSGGEGLRAICTGEAMPRDLAEELVRRCAELWNGYGPTETTVWSTMHRVQAPVTRVLIGQPVANTQIHVLDARQQPVPIGAPAELWIGGAGVSLGYLGRPDLTAERFIPDPFSTVPGARLYRTGDLGRWLPSGALECLGRNDNQVKLRGFRIELGEIEDALVRCPGVSATAVLLREDRPGDKRLVGYVAGDAAALPDDSALREQLRRTLPDYMVPTGFVRLPKLPLTPSGKIDRRALPAPQASDATASAAFVAPRTPTEELLALLWREALALPRMSVNDDFFSLGGHSLLASQILARLRRDHGIEVPFRRFFEAPTIERFAALVQAGGEAATPAPGELPLARPEGEAPRPSMLQERLLLLEEMDPAQRLVHNLPAAWRISGALDRPALERSLQEIVRRHETLRSSFRREGTRFLPETQETLALPIPFLDLLPAPAADRERLLLERLDAESRIPHDVARAPLLRVVLSRLEEQLHVLFILPQNLVWDGWSFDLFLGELSQLYTAFAAGQPSPLAHLPIRYSDYASWQRRWLASPPAAKQAEWWRGELANAPAALELPTDFPRPAQSGLGSGNEGLLLPPEEAEALRALAVKSGATLFHLTFAAYAVLLHRMSGQPELLVGTPVRARTRPEFEGLIGPFLNTLALRVKVEPAMTFGELVAQVRERTLDAFSHQELPLETLGQDAPVLRTFFSLQDARKRSPELGGMELSQQHVHPPAAAGDLMLWMMDSRRGLFAMMNFRADLFEGSTVQAMLASLRALLSAGARAPQTPLSALPLFDEAGRAEALLKQGQVATSAPEGLLEKLARHAARSPDAAALSGVGGALTRTGLQARAAAWSSAVRASQAKRLAVSLPVGPERVAALLGGLGAGAAVALLDPDAPPALVSQWLRDARADAVACRQADAAQLPPGVAGLSAETLPPADGATPAPHAPGAAALLSPASWVAGAAAPFAEVPWAALEAALDDAALSLGLAEGAVVAVAGSGALAEHPFALLLPLAAGASVRLLDRGSERDAAASSSLLSGAAALLAPAEALWALCPSVPAQAKAVGLGAPLPPALAAALRERGALPWSALGAPAAGLVSLLGEVALDGRAAPGARLSRSRLRVLDGRGAPCPPNVPGVLHLGGAGPAPEGALPDPLESAWLVPTPWRAKLRGSGALDVLGRSDGRVESRGAFLDLAVLEAVAQAHPAVARAQAGLRKQRSSDRLVLWYELKPGAAATETDLRRHLRASVSEEGLPRALIELSGTAPWKAPGGLPDPFVEAGPRAAPPGTPAEKLLAALFVEVLGPRPVAVTDNFFRLGGHSLLLFELLARLEKRTGKRLEARSLLLNTLAQAAAELGEVAPQEVAAAPRAPASKPATAPAEAPAKGSLGSRMMDRLRKLVKE
jgi:amino acid adenylation domain-containing protein